MIVRSSSRGLPLTCRPAAAYALPMLKLWYGSGSPFAWRVQLALEEKGLVYEPILLSFSSGDLKTPEHLARHPHGKVPVLADGDLVLYESTAIVEYLDERYREPSLLPRDAAERAVVRIEEIEATQYFGETFRALGRQVFFTPAPQRDDAAVAEASAAVRRELERLEQRAASRGGEFVAGRMLTRADLAWLPFVEIAERAGVPVGPDAEPWTHAWRGRMRMRPSYARSYPPHWRAR